MDFKNCSQCGKIYISGNEDNLCPQCQKTNERAFYRVREYVRKRPDADMKTISEECDVSMKLLKGWLKKEMVEIGNAIIVESGLECERCKRSIRTGRFCRECKRTILGEINRVLGIGAG